MIRTVREAISAVCTKQGLVMVTKRAASYYATPQIAFVSICTINSQVALPDIGLPNCMLPDNTHYDPYGL